MTSKISRLGLAALFAITLQCSTMQAARAQGPALPAVGQESMSFVVGDIFEMLPVHDFPTATYAWVLTEGKTFVQAGRAQFFRVRFIRPGTYTLNAEVTSATNERLRRTFTLNVSPRNQAQSSSESDAGTALASTNPPTDAQNRLALPAGRQVVELLPVSIDRRPLFLDLDTNVDSDGNGDAADDREASESFFETSATPLQLWFTSPKGQRTIGIRVVNGATAGNQNITLLAGATAIDQGILKPAIRIVDRLIGPGTYQFSVAFDGAAPNAPMLIRWNFGDGTESLLTEPTHEFPTEGDRTVNVLVRNLLTGEEIGSASTVVSPADTSAASSSAGPAAQSSAASKAPVKSGGSSWMWGIFKMFLIFLVAAGVGALIVFVIKKVRRGTSLQESLATLEKNLIKEGTPSATKATPTLTFAATAAPASASVPPLKPKSEPAPEPKPASTPIPPPAPKPAPAPAAPTAPAPSWLQKGLETATPEKTPEKVDVKPQIAVQSAPAPQSAPPAKPAAPAVEAKTPPAPAPAVKSEPKSKPQSESQSQSTPTSDAPPWLAATQAPKAPAPQAPASVPSQPPAPKSELTPQSQSPSKPQSEFQSQSTPSKPPTPAPVPAVMPKPTEAPKPPTAPTVKQNPAPVSAPTPPAAIPPKPAAPAISAPATAAPSATLATKPAPAPAPKPEPKPQSPAAVTTPLPKANGASVLPPPPVSPATPSAPNDDNPIAIVQVDSLDTK